MISLFLDTSTSILNIFFVKNDKIIFEKHIEAKNDHSTYLVSLIKEGLDNNHLNVNDINKIYVTNGPGSFTGVRIAITVAKVLAYSLNIDVIPVSSLKQYIYGYDNYDFYIPILEDRKGLYFGIYDKNYRLLDEELYIQKEALRSYLNSLNGKILLISDSKYDGYETKEKKINIKNLINDNQNSINAHNLKPNYVKKIEAESKL